MEKRSFYYILLYSKRSGIVEKQNFHAGSDWDEIFHRAYTSNRGANQGRESKIKSEYFPTDSKAKSPSEAREKKAGVRGSCKPPNGARGEAPENFEISSL